MTGSVAKRDRLRLGVSVLLVFLVAWPLFAGGMYKESYQFVAVWHVTLALVGAMALGAAEGRRFACTPGRVAGVVLWASYVIAALVSPSTPRSALQEVIKQGLYLAAFLVASELVVSTRPKRDSEPAGKGPEGWRRLASPGGLALGIWAAAAAMALASLGAAAGLVPSDFILAGRNFTYIQYPNSAGALFAAAFLLGLGAKRAWQGGGRWLRPVMAVGQWSLLTAVVLTLSRGVWLVFPLALAVLVLLWPRGQRLAVVAEVILLGASALAVAPLWLSHLGERMPGVLFLAAGLALAVLVGWAAGRVETLSLRRGLLWVAIVAVAGVAAVVGLYQAGLLPESLVSRIAGFSLSDRSAWARIEWTRDALSMVKDYPVFGVGGGGWAPRYFQYQGFPYYTKEVHNGFAETWLEAGSLGFAAFLGLLVFSGLAIWRSLKARQERDPGTAMLLAGLGAGAAMVVFHSVLDIDLSLGCVGVFLWAVLGMIDGLFVEAKRAKGQRPPGLSPAWPRGIVLGVAFVLSLVGASLFAALGVEDRAIGLYEQGKYQESREAFALACRLDPLSPRLRMERAAVLERLAGQTPDQADLDAVRTQLEAAVRLDPYNPDPHALYATFCLSYVSVDLGVQEFTRALDLQPWELRRHEKVAEVHCAVGFSYLRAGDASRARNHLSLTIAAASRLEAQATGKAPAGMPPELALPPTSPLMCLEVGKAQALLGDYREAASLLKVAYEAGGFAPAQETQEATQARQVEAMIWLSLVEERLGDIEAAKVHTAQARAITANADAVRDFVAPFLGLAGAP